MSLLLLFPPAAAASGTGSANITLSALTTDASGTLDITGEASLTLAALTTTASGTLDISGSSAITLDALTTDAAGEALGSIEGSASITLDDLTVSAFQTEPIVSRVTPAGRPSRRRRYVVEIDGEDFEVESVEHARALLDQARELAAQQAAEVAAREVPKRAQAARRVGRTKPVPLATPTIRSPDPELAEAISAARRAINEIYRQASIDAELALRLRQRMADEDEDEAVTLLLM